jgi:hypothetical protein
MMRDPIQSSTTLPRNSRMEWIALGQGQGPMIAKVTLVELAAALGAAPDALVAAPAAASGEPPLVASLEDLPALAEVGNVAVLSGLPGRSVAVARIGREGFVAFVRAKTGGALGALAATFDPAAGTLTLGEGAGAH